MSSIDEIIKRKHEAQILRRWGFLPPILLEVLMRGEFEGVPFRIIDSYSVPANTNVLVVRNNKVELETIRVSATRGSVNTTKENWAPVYSHSSIFIELLID